MKFKVVLIACALLLLAYGSSSAIDTRNPYMMFPDRQDGQISGSQMMIYQMNQQNYETQQRIIDELEQQRKESQQRHDQMMQETYDKLREGFNLDN